MEYIPAEVLEHIFDYLPVKDIINCLKVCRAWHGILSGTDSLLSGRDCVIKCHGKLHRSKHVWHMLEARQPKSVVLRNTDFVSLQLLYKYHPHVASLAIDVAAKQLKKIIRLISLFKNLQRLSLIIKGDQVTNFSVQWIHGLPQLQQFIIGCTGSLADEPMPHQMTHLALYKPKSLNNTLFLYLTHLEVNGVTDQMFEVIRDSLEHNNVETCVLTHCMCTTVEFPTGKLRKVSVHGVIVTSLKFNSAIDSAVLTLFAPLPECILPDTVERLSLRGIKTTNVHWFLACSIACNQLTTLDLNGFALKASIAASLGQRFPRLTHLNIINCLSRHVDHMYLIALLNDGRHLKTLSCTPPPDCPVHEFRALYTNCFISSIDYTFFSVNCDLNF